jgi:hypothetical protein
LHTKKRDQIIWLQGNNGDRSIVRRSITPNLFFFLDLARLDPWLQNRGLVQFLACFLQNVLSCTYVSPNFVRSVSLQDQSFRPKDRYRTVLNWFNIQSFIKLSKRSKILIFTSWLGLMNLRSNGPSDYRAVTVCACKIYKICVRNIYSEVKKPHWQLTEGGKHWKLTNRYHNTSSVSDMLDQLEWPSLESRRTNSRLTMMYKMTKNLANVDTSDKLIPLQIPSSVPQHWHHLEHSNPWWFLDRMIPSVWMFCMMECWMAGCYNFLMVFECCYCFLRM